MGSNYPSYRPCSRGAFTAVEILVAIACVVLLLVILLPAIGAARRMGRENGNRSNTMGLLKAEVIYAGSNKEYFTSYDGVGCQIVNTPIPADRSVWGAAVIPSDGNGVCASWSAYQIASLLNDGGVAPKTLITPHETNAQVVEIAADGNVDVTLSATGGCFSYSMLSAFGANQVDSSGSFSGSNASGAPLVAEWKDNSRSNAILFGYRVLTQQGGQALTSNQGTSSVMTASGSGRWKGALCYGDAHCETQSSMDVQGLRYGANGGNSRSNSDAGVFHAADTTSASSYTGNLTGQVFDTGMLWSAVRQ